MDGEVTLSGSVMSRDQKRRAEDVAERISGVRDVTNQLRVTRNGMVTTGPPTRHEPPARHYLVTSRERGRRKRNFKQDSLWNFRVRRIPTLKPSGEESAPAESSPGRISLRLEVSELRVKS